MAQTYAQESIWSGRRLVALLVAIAVNLGMIVAISNGLNFDFVKAEPAELDLVQVPENLEPRDVIEIPVPPVAKPTPQEIALPPPEFTFEIEAPPQEMTTTTEITLPPVVTPRASTELQAQSALAPPIYPPASIRGGEQGTVTLLIYVLPDGTVGDVRVAKSSGYPRLDQAAMKAALGGWRFRAATQSGAGVAAWGRYAVTFNLRDAQ